VIPRKNENTLKKLRETGTQKGRINEKMSIFLKVQNGKGWSSLCVELLLFLFVFLPKKQRWGTKRFCFCLFFLG